MIWKVATAPELEVYYFNEEFDSCALVFYDVAQAPALPFEEGVITYDFTDDLMQMTSSPQDLGGKEKVIRAFIL